MATFKEKTQKPLWNMVPYDKQLFKVDDAILDNVNTYKMFPSDCKITKQKYFDALKEFKSPRYVVPVIDYSWTTSPITAREDIPYIILNEKRPWKNNTFAKLIYSLMISKEYYDTLKQIIETQGSKLSPNAQKIIKFLDEWFKNSPTSIVNQNQVTPSSIQSNNEVNKIYEKSLENNRATSNQLINTVVNTLNIGSNKIQTNVNNLKSSAKEIANQLKSDVKNTSQSIFNKIIDSIDYIIEFLNNFKDTQILDDIKFCSEISNLRGPTESYKNLYLCLNTGFQYILPYFDNNMRSINSQWDITGKNVNPILSYIDKGVSGFNQILGAIETTTNLAQEKQGFYFEQSKPYNYPQNGETITIKFPLINTNTWNDVIANWQFVFLLLYQNQPTRNDIAIIDPPVLYEVEIPNVRYIPYAYISSLKVEYKGTRRNMNVPIMKNGKIKEITTIIPEAWDITINLTGLTSEPSNFNILNKNIITTQKL